MYKLKKKELAQAIVDKANGMSLKDAETALEALEEVIREQLLAGNAIPLPGLGTFSVKERKERTGHNPRKPGETIVLPSQNVPVFKVSSTLKRAVAE